MNGRTMIQWLLGTDQLSPYRTLTEKPAVVGRLFAGVFVAFMVLWELAVAVWLARDVPVAVRTTPLSISSILHFIDVSFGVLCSFIVLTLFVFVVSFMTARFVWQKFVVGHDRLTYSRSVSVGLLIGVGSILVLLTGGTILGGTALVVVGWVIENMIGPNAQVGVSFFVIMIIFGFKIISIAVRHVMWVAIAGVILVIYNSITIGVLTTINEITTLFVDVVALGVGASVVVILYGFPISIALTLGMPLVLPVVVCVWLTWRSRHEAPDHLTAA